MSIHTSITLFLIALATATSGQQKAVLVIVDGIPADVIEKLNPPALKEIALEGGFTRAYVGGQRDTYTQSPTVSAVGYNHVLTGTWSNKHNVWDNDIASPNYHYWNIFRIAKEANPQVKTAIFSTWLDNRTKLVGDKLLQAGSVSIDYAFDGFELDTIRFPHTKDSKFIYDIDELVSVEAARCIEANGPDLSWVYLEFTDDMGHTFGDGPEFYDAVKKADAQIDRIWKAIKKRSGKFNEDWLILITTDHGRSSANGKGHGGQSDRERTTWITTNARNLNKRFTNQPAAVDIAPSLLKHLRIEIPNAVRAELDGTPFIGDIAVQELRASIQGNSIELTWEALKPSKKNAEIFIATTNYFKEGKPDQYRLVGKTRIDRERFTIDVSNSPSSFYKILVKTAPNWTNTWVLKQK